MLQNRNRGKRGRWHVRTMQFPLIPPESRKEVVKEWLTTEEGDKMNTLNINFEQ